MSDKNDFKPADTDNNLLAKILNRLGLGGPANVTLFVAVVAGTPSGGVAGNDYTDQIDLSNYDAVTFVPRATNLTAATITIEIYSGTSWHVLAAATTARLGGTNALGIVRVRMPTGNSFTGCTIYAAPRRGG
jgi:hypothetical protein